MNTTFKRFFELIKGRGFLFIADDCSFVAAFVMSMAVTVV